MRSPISTVTESPLSSAAATTPGADSMRSYLRVDRDDGSRVSPIPLQLVSERSLLHPPAPHRAFRLSWSYVLPGNLHRCLNLAGAEGYHQRDVVVVGPAASQWARRCSSRRAPRASRDKERLQCRPLPRWPSAALCPPMVPGDWPADSRSSTTPPASPPSPQGWPSPHTRSWDSTPSPPLGDTLMSYST